MDAQSSKALPSNELRVLPTDYPVLANLQIRQRLGVTDFDFAAMRRPYDDPRRTPSKRKLLARIREYCLAQGQELHGE
jgi:hypothetical protein